MRTLLPLFALACTTATQPLPSAPPPFFTLNMHADVVHRDGNLTGLIVLPPGAPIGNVYYYVAVTDGDGTPICPRPLMGDCLDVTGQLNAYGPYSMSQASLLNVPMPQGYTEDEVHVQIVIRWFNNNYFSNPAMLSVINPQGPDFNADGYADLVISAPSESDPGTIAQEHGAAHVLYGSSGGLVTTRDNELDNPTTTSEPGEYFGATRAVGDFNGDGYDDLAIGSPREGVSGGALRTGVVRVYNGSPAGISTVPDWVTIPFTALQENGTDYEMGTSLAAGDLNYDGIDDLLIGIPGRPRGRQLNVGAAAVALGNINGLPTQTFLIEDPTGMSGADQNDRIGTAVAICDWDNDGQLEFALGAPQSDNGSQPTGSGSVHVYDNFFNPRLTLLTGDDDSRFGSAIACGHPTSADSRNLYIGAPGHDNLGAVWETESRTFTASVFAVGDTPGGDFGSVLGAFDITGDGLDEIFVSNPTETVQGIPSNGTVSYFTGAASVIPTNILTGATHGASNHARAWFGAMLESGDYDGDGVADLAIGVPGSRASGIYESGALVVHAGSSTGLSFNSPVVWTQDLATTGATPETGDMFGGSYPYHFLRPNFP